MMLAVHQLFAALLLAEPRGEAPHVPLPPVNLGGSNFLDGVARPGAFFRGFVSAGSAPRFYDDNGRSRPGAHSLSTVVAVTHAGFLLPHRVLGGYWGADLLVPVVHVTVNHDGDVASATGLGDVVASPLVIQWPGAHVDARPAFASRLSLSLVVPTGSYNQRAGVNTSSGVFSVNPYYAFTVMLTDKLETSWRFHYLWSAPNPRPTGNYGAEQVQSGQAVHANAALSFALSPQARVGVAGYFLAQTTAARIDGHAVSRARERVVGVGPAIRLSLGTFQITLSAFWELAAASRPAGFRAGLSLVKLWSIEPRRRRPA